MIPDMSRMTRRGVACAAARGLVTTSPLAVIPQLRAIRTRTVEELDEASQVIFTGGCRCPMGVLVHTEIDTDGSPELDVVCGPGFHDAELSARGAQVVAFYHGPLFHPTRRGSKRMR